MNRLFKPLISGLLLLAVASVCYSAEFSAKFTQKIAGTTMSGMEYVKNNKIRLVVSNKLPKQVTIIRQDKQVTFQVNLDDKTYEEYPYARGDLSQVTAARAKRLGDVKKIGTETINGFVCDKYSFEYKNKDAGTGTQWIAKKIGWPIKTEIKSKMGEVLIEMTDIKIEKQPDKLFEPPKGFKIIKVVTGKPSVKTFNSPEPKPKTETP